MKHSRVVDCFILGLFLLLPFIFFKGYFLGGKVLAPFNLLVSYYSPWKFTNPPEYPNGVANKPLGFDNLKLFYPYRSLTIESLKRFRVPLWNPYVFSGNVHLATYQSAVFYPFSLVYFFFPMADAWSILVIIQPILTGLFMYLFLRSLHLSKKASLLGALGFAYSGFMMSLWQEVLVMTHAILWLPLALYASNSIWIENRLKKGFIILVLSLAFSIFAGFLQMSMYLFITVIAWNGYLFFSLNDQKRKLRNVSVTVCAFILSFLMSSIQWVPAIEAYLLSPRNKVNAKFIFDAFLSPLYHLITFLVPDFWGNPGTYNYFGPLTYIQERTIYVSVYILLFVFVGFFLKTKAENSFWKIFTAITFSLGLAIPTSWIFYIFHIPILSVAQPARIFVLSTFGMCVLASYGFERIEEEVVWKYTKRILAVFFILLTVLWIFVLIVNFFSTHIELYPSCKFILMKVQGYVHFRLLDVCDMSRLKQYGTVSLRNLVLPSVTVILVWIQMKWFRNRNLPTYIFIVLLSMFGSLYFSQKLIYYSDRSFEYPNTTELSTLKQLAGFNRVWSYGDGYMMRNIPSFFRLFSAEGYDALYPQWYAELLYSIRTSGKLTNQVNRTDADLSETGIDDRMDTNWFRLRILSLTGTKYILEPKNYDNTKKQSSPEMRFPPDLFRKVWEDDRWRIWEYLESLPRVYLAPFYFVETDNQKTLNILFDRKTDLRTTIILDSDPQISKVRITDQPGVGSATIRVYEPERIVIQTQSSQDTILFLSDTYYPGWNAYVDGKRTPIYRANYAFRAVRVPSGSHIVEERYEPVIVTIAVIGTGVGIVAFIVAIYVYHAGKGRA